MLLALHHKSRVEIEGSADELKTLVQNLNDCADLCEIDLSVPALHDERGLSYVRRLILTVRPGFVSIAVLNEQLIISGEKDKLLLLSGNVAWLVREGSRQKREHTHIEYYPGHFFLLQDALPLVVTRQEMELERQ